MLFCFCEGSKEEGIFEFGLACLLKVLVGWCAFCCWGDIFCVKMMSMGMGVFSVCVRKHWCPMCVSMPIGVEIIVPGPSKLLWGVSTCALVVRSGAGKATLLHILLRFCDSHQGRIAIDGVPLTELNLKSFHDVIGRTPSYAMEVSRTIMPVDCRGIPLTMENCGEFIEKMEEDYDMTQRQTE